MDRNAAFQGWRCYFLVQPSLFLYIFGIALVGTVTTDLIVYDACKVVLGPNASECDVLHLNSSSDEALKLRSGVQAYAGRILMAQSLMQSLLPALLSLFLGPWSDKHGRRPLLISGYLGATFGGSILTILSNLSISPWYILSGGIPSSIFGGFCLLLFATYCYICDIMSEGNRMWHLAWIQAMMTTGFLFGTLIGPLIYDSFGYAATFAVATICHFTAAFHVIFFVPESVNTVGSGSCRKLFNWHYVKDLLSTCILERLGFDRCIVWCCICAITVQIFMVEGEFNISYLFASAKFGWNMDQYSIFQGVSMVVGTAGMLFGIKVISTHFGSSNVLVAILAPASASLCAIMKAFATNQWHMYLSVVLGMFNGMLGPILRNKISEAIPSQDIGKAYALTAVLETITPLGASAIYITVYSHTLPPIYPSMVWFISVVACLLLVTLLFIIHRRSKVFESQRYTPCLPDN